MMKSLNHFIRGNVTRSQKELNGEKLPRYLVYFIAFICLLPFTLNIFGIDFSSVKIIFDPSFPSNEMTDHRFQSLSGAFTHALLEWSAFTIAILTVLLAFSHYAIKKDPATPIIAIALLCAGFMDGFHTLAATRLIEAAAPNKDLIPFTWALCRLFNGLICLFGVGIFLIKPKISERNKTYFILGVSLFFIAAAYITIHFAAISDILPQTQFPNSAVTRPWDVYPFFIFILTAIAYIMFFYRSPSPFVHALIISTIPDLAVQLHMAMGSSSLFDNHFNIAHFLKIIAYLVPFIGLVYDHFRTYQKSDLIKEKLMQSNEELSQFSYRTSHDLKAPLTTVRGLSQVICEDLSDGDYDEVKKNVIQIGVHVEKLETLVTDILNLAQADLKDFDEEQINFEGIINDIKFRLEKTYIDNKVNLKVNIEPSVKLAQAKTRIVQVLENLISNSIKYCDSKKSSHFVQVSVRSEGSNIIIMVEDNGLGIPAEFHERMFLMFQRFHPDVSYGSGLGMYIVKKHIDRMHANISFESSKAGTKFKILIPRAS